MIDLEKLSERDKILAQELDRCWDSFECYRISEEAENEMLKMLAHKKSMRLYHEEEYKAGLL